MHKIFLLILLASISSSCLKDKKEFRANGESNAELNKMYEDYYEEYLQLFPLDATTQGDNRYNDKLPNNITADFRTRLATFYRKYLNKTDEIVRESLEDSDKTSYDSFRYLLINGLDGLQFKSYLTPFDQFWGLPLTMGQLGSGDGSQPFRTVADYENWLRRVSAFKVWGDSAIMNFQEGSVDGYVLPKALVVKMIPQMQDLITQNPTQHLFYGPISKLPETFSESDKIRLTGMYKKAIREEVVPTYQRLLDFLQKEYIYKARSSSGLIDFPEGDGYYKFLIKQWTTTNLTPDEIFEMGTKEVARIKGEMEKVKKQVGFVGDLPSFFEFMKTDKQFYPYKTPEEVLAAFDTIHTRVMPNVAKIFNKSPKTAFEIRRTEDFREASASAEYNQGSADGSRPGIFYVPIPDATKFNITSGMESLFLHEAIPGHHYQVSLQQENTKLPKFMRFGWYGAHGEGWALYCESLGKELGLYTDPYQYMGALGDEMHRSIRLVVDVGLHDKGWSREKAIDYMLANEPASREYATMEIERYMAIPGQALSYKVGALKIAGMRDKYKQKLGNKFKLAVFHDELLKDGCLPLEVLERKMDAWAKGI